MRESACISSCVRNSMFEKLDTGINYRKGELPFSSEVFKISSKLCFMGIQNCLWLHSTACTRKGNATVFGVFGAKPLSDKSLSAEEFLGLESFDLQ